MALRTVLSPGGNWSAPGTWVGGLIPGDGDTWVTAFPLVVDDDRTFGTSPTTPAVEGTVQAGGSLTIAAGVTLTMRGDIQLENTVLTMEAGSTLKFDSSLAAGTPIYKVRMSSAASQQNTKFVANGTSGARCTVTKAAGSGNGQIGRYVAGTSAWAQYRCTYTDFLDLGTSAPAFATDAIEINVNNTAAAEGYFDHCVFTRCGRRVVTAMGAARDFVWTFNESRDDLTAFPLWCLLTDRTTGLRTITDNVLTETRAYVGSTTGPAVVFQGSYGGVTFERNVAHKVLVSGVTVYTPFASWKDNLCITRGGSLGNASVVVGYPGDLIGDTYIFNDSAVAALDAVGISTSGGTPGTGRVTYERATFETTQASENGDFGIYGVPTAGNLTVRFTRALSLPNSRGRASGGINGHGSRFTTIELDRNTLLTSDNTAPSATGLVAFWHGSAYIGHTGMYAKQNDNLIWAKAVRATGQGNWISHHAGGFPTTGTATAGTTSTLTDSSKTFPTAAGLSFGAAGAFVYITGKTGSGPEVGEVRIITANTATQVTVDTPFSAAPDTGTTYRIMARDTLAESLNNAVYNIGDGTVYDENGVASATRPGYNAFYQTNYTTLGSGNVSLGTGTDEMTQGPMFRDSTRNFARFDSAYLGNSATGWVTATAYAVGDIVSRASADFYNNATINYRCVAAHTSGAGTEPGVGATWRNLWELATSHRMREAVLAGTTITDPALGLVAVSYITALQAWVRDGFVPLNPALKASTTGGWIGAMEGTESPSAATLRRYRRYQLLMKGL